MNSREEFEKWAVENGYDISPWDGHSGYRSAPTHHALLGYLARQPEIVALLDALTDALQWIDAVPADLQLPTMPGFDRDYVNEILCKYKEKP